MPAPTNAEIAYQQSGLLDRWTLYTTQLRDWLGGVATGGPNGDGAYPLQDVTGATFLVPCVAAWQAKVDAITDPLTGLQVTVDQSVTDAQSAAGAAATSETNAANSATAASSSSQDASMYATNSANSAAAALSSKNAAATSETNAAASATAAATSETNAATSATAASTSATDADNDATAAANSAAAADASAQQAATYAAGRLTYIGTWDVSGGTLPAIGNKGDFYAITGTATVNGVEYANGDMAVSDGSTGFDKIDNTDKVTSVAGLIGTISTGQLQTALNLGTAAYQPTTAFATAAQGVLAASAVQPNTSPVLSGIKVAVPADYWTGSAAGFFGTTGFVGTNGSFALSLRSNGYRNTSGGWTSMGINGLSTGSGIDFMPDGTIKFLSGSPSGTDLPSVATLSPAGNLALTGSVFATNIGSAAAQSTSYFQKAIAGKALTKITVSSAAPGTLADGELYLQY